MSIEIGVILPTSTGNPEQPIMGDVRASARFAEEAGLESVWSTDRLVASSPILDSTVVLATAAAVTERIRIGFGVMLLALRPVAWGGETDQHAATRQAVGSSWGWAPAAHSWLVGHGFDATPTVHALCQIAEQLRNAPMGTSAR